MKAQELWVNLPIYLTTYWIQFKCWLFGRQRFIGYDYAYGKDKSVMVEGYKDRNGVMHITGEYFLEPEHTTKHDNGGGDE